MKSLKKILKTNELTIGSWITLGHPSIAEIMAKAGFEWLTIDMEHSAITLDEAQNLVQIIELSGLAPLVRVGENNSNLIKRVMDIGAHGVIVPMVNTEEDALKAINAVKYPPEGTRGVGLARAQAYGMEFERYREWVSKESIVIAQIEHITAVDNLEKILGTKGIDGFIVGPYDLSASMGKTGDLECPEMLKTLKEIAKIARERKVAPGIHVVQPDTDQLLQRVKEGYTFIAFSFDALFLATKCGEELSKIKGLRGK